MKGLKAKIKIKTEILKDFFQRFKLVKKMIWGINSPPPPLPPPSPPPCPRAVFGGTVPPFSCVTWYLVVIPTPTSAVFLI